jgi:hypothetical protein
MGALGGKLAADNQPPVVVVPQVQSAADAPETPNKNTVTE